MIVLQRPSDEPGSVPLALLHGSDGSIVVDAYEDDRPLVLSSAVIDIGLNIDDTPGAADHYVDGAAATVGNGYEGSSNRVSYTFSASDHPDDPDKDITVVLTITTNDSRTIKHRFLLDLLQTVPVPVVREEDLFVRRPVLREAPALGIEEGDPTDGSTTTLVDTRLIGLPSYKGGRVEILEGTNVGLWREVTAFDASTGTATVNPAWPAAVDTTSRYRIRRSWEPLIRDAWIEIRRRVREFGWGLDLTDPHQLREPHLLLSLSLCFEALGESVEDQDMADDYRKRAFEQLDAIKLNFSAHDDEDTIAAAKPAVAHVEAGRR